MIKDSFSLILKGEYEQAIIQSEENFKENQWLGEKYNKVIALLLNSETHKAYNECKELIDISSDNQYYKLFGVCCWLISFQELAIKYWILDLEGNRVDLSKGLYTILLLYYAGISCNDSKLIKDSLTKLKRYNKNKNILSSHHILASYVLNETNSEDMLAVIENEESMKSRFLCKAYFQIAMKNKEHKDSFKNNLSKIVALNGNSILESEFYLAKYELQNNVEKQKT